MTTYTLRKASPAKTRADVVVVGVHQAGPGPVPAAGAEDVAKAFGRSFAPLLAQMAVTGALGETVRLTTEGRITSPVLVVVGLGPAEEMTHETLRRAAGIAVRGVGNASSVAVALPSLDAESVRAVTEGLRSGGYTTQKVTAAPAGRRAKDRRPASTETGPTEVAVLGDCARQKACLAAFDAALVVGELTDVARGWVNTPANLLGPVELAEAMASLRTEGGKARRAVEVQVVEQPELERLGCGGILGVASGSSRPARLVRLTYRPKNAVGHVALVGKGITYDSGGLTIKPGSSMKTMKNDMGGSAAVVAATYAVAELELPVSVTTFAPLAENMVSGDAMRPGDVLTMYDGQTVEIQNTDAEGRLVLADALAMAAELEPDTIVEMSTLTGACVTALGERIAGLFGEDASVAAVQRAAEVTGELFWRLPIPEHTTQAIRSESTIADLLQHNWVRWGSSSWAAGFLQEFVKGRPWAHLDVAGPAWNSGSPWGSTPSGATGFGVRTLVELCAQVAQGRGDAAQ